METPYGMPQYINKVFGLGFAAVNGTRVVGQEEFQRLIIVRYQHLIINLLAHAISL